MNLPATQPPWGGNMRENSDVVVGAIRKDSLMTAVCVDFINEWINIVGDDTY